MPVDFLTTEQTESYGRFTGEPDELQPAPDIFTLMKQTRNLSGKAEVITTVWALPCKLMCLLFWAPSSPI